VTGIINWIKTHKLVSVLVVVILFLLLGKVNFLKTSSSLPGRNTFQASPLMMKSDVSGGAGESYIPPSENYPPTDTKNRLVIQDSNLSLLVKDVKGDVDKIINFAKENNGYMVNSSLSSPNDVASANLTIRVPSRKLKQTLDYLRNLSVKVVSENLYGEDVTDQYTDINARLETLLKTKAKFEEILAKATQIQDILNVQRELITLQDQIDSLQGQQLYLEKSAELTRITIYLSVDELALPYAPSESWRPEVIFKTAVRSLVSNLRGLATLIIWVVVFSVFWGPVVIAIYIYKKRKSNSESPK